MLKKFTQAHFWHTKCRKFVSFYLNIIDMLTISNLLFYFHSVTCMGCTKYEKIPATGSDLPQCWIWNWGSCGQYSCYQEYKKESQLCRTFDVPDSSKLLNFKFLCRKKNFPVYIHLKKKKKLVCWMSSVFLFTLRFKLHKLSYKKKNTNCTVILRCAMVWLWMLYSFLEVTIQFYRRMLRI